MKVCLFGGTFDPPHIGHLLIAQTVCEVENFDKVFFIPAFSPPHKNSITSADHRINMIKIAIEDNPKFNKYEIHTQAKHSGFRIDLALYNPESSQYILGIECDGARYHSSQNAKDRDINRQRILESKGWEIFRIWSTDWFDDPMSEIQRLEDKILELQTRSF